MTSSRLLEFLLFLLVQQACSEEAEPVIREEGSFIEMGYCFGVDYIVVYRCTPEGDQLLGNSSDDSNAITPPADLQGRIHINKQNHLLGLQIHQLTHLEAGIYRRECWKNHTLVNHLTQQLLVCDEQSESEEVVAREEYRAAELRCNSSSLALEGTSVRWYHEMHPSQSLKLLLDSSLSLEPLVDKAQGAVAVRNNGTRLLLDDSLLKNNQNFYCLVMRGNKCLSFQKMHQAVLSESRDVFASQGDTLVLSCPLEGDNQQWDTPLGSLNRSSVRSQQMYITVGEESEDFSLVVPAFSDEHIGEYSCITPSREVQYSLFLCPRKPPKESVVSEGVNLSLECDVGQDEFHSVQWYRQEAAGSYHLLHDSSDRTGPVPEDLRGRLTLSETGTSLRLSGSQMKDGGLYWCVVLSQTGFLEGDYDYEGDYDVEDNEEYEYDYNEDQYWYKTSQCIFKQENNLLLTQKESNKAAYAAAAGLAVLAVVGLTVAVIAVKKRAKTPPKSREVALRSRINKNDTALNVDPGCTEGLTHNAEFGA